MTSNVIIPTKPVAKEVLINSCEYFHINWQCWKYLGIVVPPKGSYKRFAYLTLSILVNMQASFLFPIHLMLGIFLDRSSKSVLFENVTIVTTCIGTIGKFYMFATQMKKIKLMEEIIQELDKRVQHQEEEMYYNKRIRRNIAQIQFLYIIVYLSIGFTASLAFIFSEERRLFYPGWLPFDWRYSTTNHTAAICYQLFCTFFEILQNFANDSFSPKALCILSGHIKLLYKRVSRIGYDKKSTLLENEEELNRCVADHMHLYRLFDSIQNIISWPMLLQFFVSLVNSCIAMVVLLFFVKDTFYRVYYVFYFIGMSLQLFPACYYGSHFVMLFENLHYAVFSCNWIGQSKRFKRHMMLFTERSLKRTMALAGGMFPIHLNTFFATCKGAYSLFAVVLRMK